MYTFAPLGVEVTSRIPVSAVSANGENSVTSKFSRMAVFIFIIFLSNKLLCHFYILFLRGDCQTYFREKVLALLVTYYLI